MHDEDANSRDRMNAAKELIKFTESTLQSIAIEAKVSVDPIINFGFDLGDCSICGSKECAGDCEDKDE